MSSCGLYCSEAPQNSPGTGCSRAAFPEHVPALCFTPHATDHSGGSEPLPQARRVRTALHPPAPQERGNTGPHGPGQVISPPQTTAGSRTVVLPPLGQKQPGVGSWAPAVMLTRFLSPQGQSPRAQHHSPAPPALVKMLKHEGKRARSTEHQGLLNCRVRTLFQSSIKTATL